MRQQKSLAVLVGVIVLLSLLSALFGLLGRKGDGRVPYESVRGETVLLHGEGPYRHMSGEVALQGIAQDYVTLFIALPLFLFSFFAARRGSLRARYLLAGTLAYFLVTYLFYLVMGMFNELFLAYSALTGASFFALAFTLASFDIPALKGMFHPGAPRKTASFFLIFNASVISLLWLSVVLPPLLDGSIYPRALEHYTTLPVQGLDLGLFLPLSFYSGLLFARKDPRGYLFAPVYLIFLSVLMTALTAKVIAMEMNGYPAGPALAVIPLFMLASWGLSAGLLSKVRSRGRK
ncbi:MAG TPA: hypothetical protein PLJ93_04000 [Candidatus Mcinerneyibacteriales bacterium]|nr:hypothetical protein [Candidatus Mcinerneyibacteriales bacterium]